MNVKSSRSPNMRRSPFSGQGDTPAVKVTAVIVSVVVLLLFIVFLYHRYLSPPPLAEVQDNDATRPRRELDTGSGGMDNDATRGPQRDTRAPFSHVRVV